VTNTIVNAIPTWLLGILIVGSCTAISMACVFILRRRLALEVLKKNNEVAGFKFAVVGVLFGIVAAGAMISAWEDYSEAKSVSNEEGNLVVVLYRLAQGFPEPTRSDIRSELKTYAQAVIEDDWPAMAREEAGLRSQRALEAMCDTLADFRPSNAAEEVFLSKSLEELDYMNTDRRKRILQSEEGIPGVMWAVLILGGVFTICFCFFFGNESVRTQAYMTGVLAATMSLCVFVVFSLNDPFAGDTKVEPEAMRHALEYIQQEASLQH